MKEIISLDSRYIPMNRTDRQSAIKAVVSGRAYILDISTYEKLMDVSKIFDFIIFPNRIAVNYSNKPQRFSKKILERDHYKCGYCLKKARTIDHIIPKAQGGSNLWSNLIACCWECNQRKGDKTPEQAGMPLLFKPRHRNQILFDDFHKKANEKLK